MMDTAEKIRTVVSVNHLATVHLVGPWVHRPMDDSLSHPITGVLYAKITWVNKGDAPVYRLTVWDRTDLHIKVVDAHEIDNFEIAKQHAEHVLRLQGVIFMKDLL